MSAKPPATERVPSEFDLIAQLRRGFETVAARGVVVGIGDDAAVLDGARVVKAGTQQVWTIDDCVEGVHFRRDWLTLGDAAARAFHAAASDLAAMGAEPWCALSSLGVPRRVAKKELSQVGRGQLRASRQTDCPIVGGNVSRADGWRFTTTLLGYARNPVSRSTARPGHVVWLVGTVGMAACGRIALQSRQRSRWLLDRAIARCVSAWRRPVAQLRAGASLDGRVHACIDVSDGLAADAGKLAESSAVRLVVDRDQLRAALHPALLRAARAMRRDPVQLALAGGEDYSLLVCGPIERRPRGGVLVGEVCRGRGVRIRSGGSLEQAPTGFEHLA